MFVNINKILTSKIASNHNVCPMCSLRLLSFEILLKHFIDVHISEFTNDSVQSLESSDWILMILYLMVMCCSLHFVVFWNPPVLYRMLRGSSHVGDAEKSLPFTAFLCVCLHSLCLAHNDSCTKFITSSALQLFGKDCLTKQDKTTPSFTDFVSSQRVLSHLTPFKLEC